MAFLECVAAYAVGPYPLWASLVVLYEVSCEHGFEPTSEKLK